MVEGANTATTNSISIYAKFALVGLCAAVFFVVLSKLTSTSPELHSSQSELTNSAQQLSQHDASQTSGVVTEQTNVASNPTVALNPSVASNPSNPVVQINTSVGNLVIELYPEHAPIAVKKLIELISNNYFGQGAVLESKPGSGFVIAKISGDIENFSISKDELNNLTSVRGSVGIMKKESSPAYLNNLFVGYQSQPQFQDSYVILGHDVEGLDDVESQSNGTLGQVINSAVKKESS